MSARTAMPTQDLVSSYVLAKTSVVEAGFVDEIAWQGHARLADVDMVVFTREAAWVVLSAGMAERVVRAKFGPMGEALHGWDPVAIAADPAVFDRALSLFGHRGKIAAIVHIASIAAALDREALQARLKGNPEGFLRTLPYIGPVTWAHLAKNLGLPVAKADRHLVRLTTAYHRNSVGELCDEISDWLEEPVAVVDLVLWRYATLHAARCRLRQCAGLPHDLNAMAASDAL